MSGSNVGWLRCAPHLTSWGQEAEHPPHLRIIGDGQAVPFVLQLLRPCKEVRL
jgi:hypothetical protein